MKPEINYSRFVDRYLDGVMSTEERNWFEKELQDDMYLKKELELQEKIHETLAMKDIIDLERQLNTIYQDTYRPWVKTIRLTGNVKKVVAFATGIAAAVCLIIIGVINFSSGPTSSTDLYNTYYKPAEMNMSFRTAEDMVDGDLRSAMILYENKEYDDAIALFEKIIKTDETRIGLHLYSGISHMEIQEYDEANNNFRSIIDHKANAFIESAEWYLGLCYLMTGDDNKAREIFTDIASHQGYYRKDAKRILKKM